MKRKGEEVSLTDLGKGEGISLDLSQSNSIKVHKSTVQPTQHFVLQIKSTELDNDSNGAARTTNLADGTGLLTPRQYQLELMQRSLEQNTIAVLETGGGKTLVAVMLIRKVLDDLRVSRGSDAELQKQHKIVIFLVSLVPLVFQQRKVICANLPYRVEHMCGEMNVDLWDSAQWRDRIEANDVLVMTAQILLSMLHHGFISLEEVCLLVFDECHHTRKKHPYNKIMQEFYHRMDSKQPRPKIFGMTASPLSGSANPVLAAERLEKALDSKIYTVSNREELRSLVSRPNEISVKFPPCPIYFSSNTLVEEIETALESHFIQQLCKTAGTISNLLGPWCSLLWFRSALDKVDTESPFDLASFGIRFTSRLFSAEYDQLSQMRDIYAAYKDKLGGSDPLEADPFTLTTDQVSPKVQKLIEILIQYTQNQTFRGIIFVQQRCVALALKLALQKVSSLNGISCDCLLGHGGREAGDKHLNFKQQNRIISDFKSGGLDLLIATSVAEEGLDIQACNLVIRFDSFNNVISYIQSRGRARQKNSTYILLQEEGISETELTLEKLQKSEQLMISWCDSLPEDRFPSFSEKDLHASQDDKILDMELIEACRYEAPTTKAVIALDSCVQLLHFYCSLLPRDDFFNPTPSSEFIQDGGLHRCIINMPANAPFKARTGEKTHSKALAFQACAYKICVDLHSIGALNDHLVPENEVKDSEFTPPFHINESTPAVCQEPDVKCPDFWKSPGSWEGFYLNSLDLKEPFRPLALITRKPLPQMDPIELFLGGDSLPIKIKSATESLRLSSEQTLAISSFTLEAFQSLFKKKFPQKPEEFVYLVAPLLTADAIDWDMINTSPLPKPLDLQGPHQDLVICNTFEHLRLYLLDTILCEMNPTHRIPGNVGETESFVELYNRKYKKEVTRLDQPILRAYPLKIGYYYLHQVPAHEPQSEPLPQFIVPEFCTKFWLPGSLIRSVSLVPSILERIDGLLLSQELKEKLNVYQVSSLHVLQAFTHRSAGLQFDFERFEFIGDALLKLLVSFSVFVRLPSSHEGQLSRQKDTIVCNVTLSEISRRCGFASYLHTTPFNRRKWQPRILEPVDPIRAISRKTLADAVESAMGVSFLYGGLDSTLSCAQAMGVPLGPISGWHVFNELWLPQELSAKTSVTFQAIESIIGYRFSNQLLLKEAFTHASYPYATTPCYQRLEFLGDAILDFLVTNYLFRKYPDTPPGGLTVLRAACVNQNALAAVAETLGLQKSITHLSSSLLHGITEFSTSIQHKRENSLLGTEYWADCPCPKVISDVVEAIFGAIVVDSHFQLESAQSFFDRVFVPFLDQYVPHDVLVHPTAQLANHVQGQGCTGLSYSCTDSQTVPSVFKASVLIHGKLLASATSLSSREARKLASKLALDKVLQYPEELTCKCLYDSA